MGASGVNILEVNESNVERYGFFCMRSKRNAEGYQNKLQWLKSRFREGLKLKLIRDGEFPLGFIEYIPGEYAWRSVVEDRMYVIHCLWVLGKNKGKGYGSMLLEACEADARQSGKVGIAVVTSRQTWLPDKGIFLKHGYEVVDFAPPAFELLVKKLAPSPNPRFIRDEERETPPSGGGVTVYYSHQCPYIHAALEVVSEVSKELGLEANLIPLTDAGQVKKFAPTGYGVFSVFYNDQLITHHPVTKREFLKRISPHLS
jgi:GNAT superfamily N-acetyltransferase